MLARRIVIVVGRRDRDVERGGERLGIEHEGRRVRATDIKRVLVEEQRTASGEHRYDRRIRIGRLRREPGGVPGVAPAIHEATRDRGDRRADHALRTVADREMQRVDVPDLAAPDVALGTPALFRARTVREFEALKQNPSAVPAVGREFVRTERVLIRVRAYGPGDAAPAVSARLLNRAGDAMRDLTVAIGPDAAAAIELPLAGLATGDYLVEIAAAGASGEGARQLIGFRVTG